MNNEKTLALSEQITAHLNTLADETDATRQSDTFLAWLHTMSQFHHYSWTNQILISLQRPDASRVAGFHAWRKLNRFVKKGSTGIAIFAPCTYKRQTDPDQDDSPSIQKLTGFTVAYVFALEDTDGEPLPSLPMDAASGGDSLLPQLETAAAQLNIALSYQHIPEPNVQGYSEGGRVVIRDSLSLPAKCATLTHELIHELLHQGERKLEAKTKSRAQKELEAEATTYVVLRHFDIDHIASHYLATYRVSGEQLRASLHTISSAAHQLISTLESLPQVTKTDTCSELNLAFNELQPVPA